MVGLSKGKKIMQKEVNKGGLGIQVQGKDCNKQQDKDASCRNYCVDLK